MNIGIDLDGTITDFHKSLLINGKKFLKKHNIDYKIKEQNKFEIEDIFELSTNDLKIFKEYVRTELRMNTLPRDDAVKTINKLKENNKIFIITSRKETDQIDCYNSTKLWLDNNNIYYDKLIIGNSNKVEECQKHNINIFIDDKIKHVKKVSEVGIKSLLFDNVYNKDCTIKRIYSFKELLDILI
ncbi:MAG: hypothetical protein ACI33S_00310 [Bacilli bacterium]